MSSKKIDLDSAKKDELRSLCKKHGVKGYSGLNNDGMRAALRALIEMDPNYQTTGPKKVVPAPAPVVTTPAPAPLVLAAVTTAAREERNGVKRPRPESLCGQVWAALDQMHAANILPTTAQVRELAIGKNWSVNNAVTELSQWRRWQGLSKAQPGKHGPRRKSSAKLAGLPRRSGEEVDQYVA